MYKTFRQFLEESYDILERYYRPDEKLPSGETPMRKAIRKAVTRYYKPNKSENEKDRYETHKDKIRTHVRHGADNDIVNPYVSKKHKGEIETIVDKDSGWVDIKHKKSGVTANVINHGNKAYELHWSLDDDRKDLSPAQRVAKGIAADKFISRHVFPRLRNNRLIVTRASANESAKKKDKKGSNPQTVPSTRADIYSKKRGFSPRNAHGILTGRVRQRRGGTKITPVPPIKGLSVSGLTPIGFAEYSNAARNNPRNFAADYDETVERSGKKPKVNAQQLINPTSKKINDDDDTRKRKRPKGYSGNVARNNPTDLRRLQKIRDNRDQNVEFYPPDF